MYGQKSLLKTKTTLNVSEPGNPESSEKINIREYQQNFDNFPSPFKVPDGPLDNSNTKFEGISSHKGRQFNQTDHKPKAKKLSTNGTVIHSTRRSQHDKEKDIKVKEEQIKVITVRILDQTIT